MTILTDTRISDCCGATEQTDMPFNSDGGFCSDCKDHCEYVEIEDDETPVTFTPSYAEIATVAFIVIALFVFGVGLNAVEGVR